MVDTPWQGDACSLVDEFRAGRRSPSEELSATLAAVEASDLNAIPFIDPEPAMASASSADVSMPFGGVPMAIKELDQVKGWPDTGASVPFKDNIATETSTNAGRIRDRGGAVLFGQSAASEFGGVNCTRTVLHGATHNPWKHGHTPGGSSGGAAAAVAGGLMTLGTSGDGGGSIRIPAGFTNLVGLKATFGRIPLSPSAEYGNLTVAVGCVSRSVRDTARWFDVTNGHDPRDPLSLAPVSGWEQGLGTNGDTLKGKRVAIVANWGGATVSPVMWELLNEAALNLIDDCELVQVDKLDTKLPNMGAAWSISGMMSLRNRLGDLWPDCADDLTPEIAFGLSRTDGLYNGVARGRIEKRRTELNQAMAKIFDPNNGGVDFILTASNPDIAFAAEGPLPDTFGGIEAGLANNGLLTFPCNLHGNPGISIPAGFLDGLPIGLQAIGPHFSEPLLLELAHTVERNRPWPLTVNA
jgi:aspartyl-tRNA(Asn)/glutamyl-tRNA(Gln) amidotransferase subunit A